MKMSSGREFVLDRVAVSGFFYFCAANLGARPRFIGVRIMTEHTYTPLS